MSDRAICGLHHMSALCGDAQENVDFYVGLLGLRLIKVTVNYDDPAVYHLYYGDAVGSPGSLLTFFPYPHGQHGRPGNGQVVLTSLSVRKASVAYWQERLHEYKLGNVRDGFDFEAPDGLRLRIAVDDHAEPNHYWDGSTVPVEHAVVGLKSVTIELAEICPTERVLVDLLGMKKIAEAGDVHTFGFGDGGPGRRVHVRIRPDGMSSRGGRGSVHHVAFRVQDLGDLVSWRNYLDECGCVVSEVMDRTYFKSIYFREPAGVIFEIATESPGFFVDETIESSGSTLCLPTHLEGYRERIVRSLPKLNLP